MRDLLNIGGFIFLIALMVVGFVAFNKLGKEANTGGINQANNVYVPPVDKSVPEETETGTFGLGCFWGSDARFGVIPGVSSHPGWVRGRYQEKPYLS